MCAKVCECVCVKGVCEKVGFLQEGASRHPYGVKVQKIMQDPDIRTFYSTFSSFLAHSKRPSDWAETLVIIVPPHAFIQPHRYSRVYFNNMDINSRIYSVYYA